MVGYWGTPVIYGLHVIDVSNPANPVRVGGFSINSIWDVADVAVAGDRAYVVGKVAHQGGPISGLHVFDLSNPAKPVRVGGVDFGEGYAPGVAVSGNHAYVAASTDGLIIVDVSNSANPVRMGDVDTSGWTRGVAVSGNHAYMVDELEDLKVIDVSNPAKPVRVGRLHEDTSTHATGIAVLGNYAYVAGPREEGTNWISGLQVIDVSDPAKPVRVGSYDTEAQGVAVSGNHVYVAASNNGLIIVDVSDPANPVRVGGFSINSIWDVAVSGDRAYVVGNVVGTHQGWPISGLHVIDLSNPAKPVRVGGVDFGEGYGWGSGVAVSGNHAYVAETMRWTGSSYVGGGLQVIDVSNPANPVHVGAYNTNSGIRNVAVVGDLIYVAHERWGLLILEQSRALWLEVSGRNPFTISLSGESGTGVRLQRSSNLRDWEDWQSVTLSNAPLEFSDPDAAGATARFYRAVEQ